MGRCGSALFSQKNTQNLKNKTKKHTKNVQQEILHKKPYKQKTKKKTILRDFVAEPDPWEESLRIGCFVLFFFNGFFVFLVFFCFFLVFLACVLLEMLLHCFFVRFFGVF